MTSFQSTTSENQVGLYNPAQEHDACGVGFVADILGRKTHQTVSDAIRILVNMSHRGACGCDAETGDGAGILLQIPHEFYKTECRAAGFDLPEPGRYGVGMLFLSRYTRAQEEYMRALSESIAGEGQYLIGWRDLPVNPDCLGQLARESMPVFRQCFVGARGDISQDDFERRLYLIRKGAHRIIRERGVPGFDLYYTPSFSSRTVIYKGLLLPEQVEPFYPDLQEPAVISAIALVHSRFSTNTFPTWDLAHPYRMIAHNGEINTLRGNRNWMRAREATIQSTLFGDEINKLFPLVNDSGSDSATFDNALEFLVMGGRSLPHAMMMMVPEAHARNEFMDADKRAFYEYHACMMEPWDGPAAIAFTNGVQIGAVLDRNGLRPGRYWITRDDRVIYASESGVLDIPVEDVVHKGKMQPGRMLLIDTEQQRIIPDDEIKKQITERRPYRQWVKDHIIDLAALPDPPKALAPPADSTTLTQRQQMFGYTLEDLRMLVAPMARTGDEAIGSMGNDAPLAVLSDRPQLLYNYFKQLFAQVTNPPIDSTREALVMSTINYVGRWGNILDEAPGHAGMVRLPHPVITNDELEKLRFMDHPECESVTLSAVFPVARGKAGLERAMDHLCEKAANACKDGASIIIISDREANATLAPIPALLALAGVHHHLIREGLRGHAGLIVETGEARENHHFALLVGYGAGAINPYLAMETIADMVESGAIECEGLTVADALKNYVKATDKAILKIMAKMGISTIQSYEGAQIFEAIGLNHDVISKYFTKTASRIEGVGMGVIATAVLHRHRNAFPEERLNRIDMLDVGGQYHWRREGEHHLFNPDTIFKLQHAVRTNNKAVYQEYATLINDQSRRLCTLRGLFRFRPATPVPLSEVEPAEEIMKRFATGAMSFGSISAEAHETLAIAMNRIGARSNTGEGGEDPARFERDANGDWRRSAIKQVASGRFGVTSHYLVNADELQIKMAQGAKPGEGGQLPGHKVDANIARVRHSTQGVGLISPPPHHDIYSIEDLAQLIFDLKNANEKARISVKLVAEVGVGTVAAGVAKAHADVVLISGHDGGTGASPLTSIKHAGVPWELGLAEAQQVLVMNDLRGRIIVQTDGQLKTGRDVAIAALLGAEEWGSATAPLVALGCIMMRKCHLNTCPVGVATQDPELRKKFTGEADHVVNFFRFMAEELREIMAELGFRTVQEMIGRSDMLVMGDALRHYKTRGLDFSQIFYRPMPPRGVATRQVTEQEHGLANVLDRELIALASESIEHGTKVNFERPIRNVDRTTGTMLSSEVTRRHGVAGLPDNTIQLHFTGTAGQSFGAFVCRGITLTLEGDANDYVGKGLSGGRIIVYPPASAPFLAEDNIIAGNTCLYGATSGEAYFRGMTGERFAVRNSGAITVVEGVGDHGCEYMTGGVAVILGRTGRNFAAGMSGGLAFVLDETADFATRCNTDMVDLVGVESAEDQKLVRVLLQRHAMVTGSQRAKHILDHWDAYRGKFVKVFPREYRRALEECHATAVTAETVLDLLPA